MLYVSQIELENFRCFENVAVDVNTSASSAPWILLTGDNASGKTTLLKAIALGLCDRSSAAGLLRESDSGYIRDGQETSTIRIRLVERIGAESGDEFAITTRLTRLPQHLESLDQETEPKDDFPWDRIFVCGYGAGRGTSGTGDVAGYTAISAVYNLFNYSEGLQNPELTIRRFEQGSRKQRNILATAQNILMLDDLRLAEGGASDAGILVKDPRGFSVPLRDLADGYKSTFLWLTDFLGWALAYRVEDPIEIEGIIVIDELEQHLHPRWQRIIISSLQKTFPRVQFFAATHAPLVARSFSPIRSGGPHRHYHLRNHDGADMVEAVEVQPMGGQRMDQVLASEAFDYLLDEDPDAAAILQELSILADDEFLNEKQRSRASELRDIVQSIQSIRLGQSEPERSAATWAAMIRASIVADLDRK